MDAEYTMVAEARGQRVLWFRRFGSYQGEWLLMSRDDERYYLYKDWYGSCSGCDAIEGTFSWGDIADDDPRVAEFIEGYKPFLEMTPEGALSVSMREDNLLAVLPRNRREWQDGFEGATHEEVGRQLALVVKKEEGKITAREILELDNQELRREALESFGAESFVESISAKLLDAEIPEGNFLYHADVPGSEPYAFLYVKDPSTERRYILRTDPVHRTVREARAASFGISPERFVLAQET
jgi:hypothetical protein